MTRTSAHGVLGQTNPLRLPFGVGGYEDLLLHVMDADEVGSAGQTVVSSCCPAFLFGIIHREELIIKINIVR